MRFIVGATTLGGLLLALLAGCGNETPKTQEQTGPKLPASLPGPSAPSVSTPDAGPKIPPEAEKVFDEGEKLGSHGAYAQALLKFQKASELAPSWAYPIYEMAYTHLLLGDPEKALEEYRRTDALEPHGFFTSKTALWTLEREQDGRLPKGLYAAYVALEGTDSKTKASGLAQILAIAPDYPPALKQKALLTEALSEREALIERALALSPDQDTYGILILNKASLQFGAGKQAEARALLQKLIADEKTTFSNRSLAQDFLKRWAVGK